MPTSPSSSVRAARTAVGDRLRELRRDAGLSGRALAESAGWYKSKVSRLENAVTPPSDDDIRRWCAVCQAPEQAADLIAAARSADGMYVEWRRVQRTGLRRLQESYVPLYERTRIFRTYCANVFGDAATMAGQLGYLLTAMALPSVSLGVVPFSAERRMWMIETFTVYDDEQAEAELLTARVNVTAPTDVRQYLRAFAEFHRLAVYGAGARALITSAIRALE